MGLFSDKVPTAKFDHIGQEVEGVIVAFGKQQRTEFLPGGSIGDPMFWYRNKPTPGMAADPQTGQPNPPVMDDVVTIDTGIADAYGCTERRLFVKGKADKEAIRTACEAAGVRDVEEGGRLAKRWVSGAGGTADPRVYAYRYSPPHLAQPASLAQPPAGTAATAALDAARQAAASQARAAQRLTGGAAAAPPTLDTPPF